MVLNTARLILCLLAGHVFMVSASFNECELQEFARCDRVATEVFRIADKNQNLVDIYCNAYKEISQCLASNAECVGNFIDLVRFMVHQHTILDSKLGICTIDREPLRKLVHANEKYRNTIAGLKDLDADKFEPCTAKKNLYCASRHAEEIRSGGTMCKAASNYIECYESKYMACDDKIYKDYVADLKTAGEELIQFAKGFPNLIPCHARSKRSRNHINTRHY